MGLGPSLDEAQPACAESAPGGADPQPVLLVVSRDSARVALSCPRGLWPWGLGQRPSTTTFLPQGTQLPQGRAASSFVQKTRSDV